MKIVLFTGINRHHLYLISELFKKFNLSLIVQEKQSLKPKFKFKHKFEKFRDEYEKKNLDISIYNKIPKNLIYKTKNINSSEVFKKVMRINPDVIICSGIGVIEKKIVNQFKNKIFNLHGGNINKYRGLDSHLWAIYHNDFESFHITLHKLVRRIDAGSIVSVGKIKFVRQIQLFELRVKNIIIAAKLVTSFLKKKKNKKLIKTKKILKLGRYYSFMPYALKEICLKKFNNYAKKKFK